MSKSAVALVEAVRSSLPQSHEFDERDLALLDLAERQAADVDRLERDIAERGARVGERLNNAIPEVRQARVALACILGQVDIPGGWDHPLAARPQGRNRPLEGLVMARVRGGVPQELSAEQEINLILGPHGWNPENPEQSDLDNFESEEHLRATWLAHREDVLAGFDESVPWPNASTVTGAARAQWTSDSL